MDARALSGYQPFSATHGPGGGFDTGGEDMNPEPPVRIIDRYFIIKPNFNHQSSGFKDSKFCFMRNDQLNAMRNDQYAECTLYIYFC